MFSSAEHSRKDRFKLNSAPGNHVGITWNFLPTKFQLEICTTFSSWHVSASVSVINSVNHASGSDYDTKRFKQQDNSSNGIDNDGIGSFL